jgi:ABC-2 type transport system ATP-binding protein
MIKTQSLTKNYYGLTAVDNLTFSVEPGEVLGFLGPNGAGKTTTMRMIAGFIAPSSGSASICGHDIGTAPLAAKAQLGYLPEGAPTYGEMTVDGFLNFIADLRARSRADIARRGSTMSSAACSSIARCCSRPSKHSPRVSGAASDWRRPSCTTPRC